MIRYAIVINEETGLCNVGTGTNDKYYESIGMTLQDVELSDVDNYWYLADKCPHKPEEQVLQEAKQAKANEANVKAYEYINSGDALYEFEEGKHIEATDGNIGKFTAYALAYVTGQLQPTDTVVWNTKEDETVELSQEQVSIILNGLGVVQAIIWTVQYPAYLTQIEDAETVEEVEAIVIEYSTGE